MMSYNDEDERIPYTKIAEDARRARKPRPCSGGCSGIEAGERYYHVAEKVDGEFGAYDICQHCQAGYPRPGSAEERELVAFYDAQVRQDEEAWADDVNFARRYLAEHPDATDDPAWQYCRAMLPAEPAQR